MIASAIPAANQSANTGSVLAHGLNGWSVRR